MKLLVIIAAHSHTDGTNIKILNEYLINNSNNQVDYCCISSFNDFNVYDNIISLKYKIINPNLQLSKVCDFITDNKDNLDYDWYIKIRPDIKLLEPINFEVLAKNVINARIRSYTGPKKIKYGNSLNGPGYWRTYNDCFYDESEKNIVLDDVIYIFDNNVVKSGGFDKIVSSKIENETIHTDLWQSRNIGLNPIGINLCNMKYNGCSGDVNL